MAGKKASLLETSNSILAEGDNSLSGSHSEVVPPDPIPNSEVKRLSADDSMGFPHVKVGHRQTFIQSP